MKAPLLKTSIYAFSLLEVSFLVLPNKVKGKYVNYTSMRNTDNL